MEEKNENLEEGLNEPEELEKEISEVNLTEEPDEEKPNGKHRFITVFAVIVVLLAGVFVWRYFFSPSPSTDTAATSENEVVVSVRTAQAKKQTISSEVSAVGTIFPARQAVVSSNASGQIRGLR